MSEFLSDRVVDLTNFAELSTAEGHSKMALLPENQEIEHAESELVISESDHGAQGSEEYEQNYRVNGLDCDGDPAKMDQSQSPEEDGSHKTDCNDPDVKPTHSYIALIAMAILSCPNKKMILGDIYQYISDNFLYYRNKDKSWRNSIRHNLSLNECFIKAGRSENGKGNYWAIHPANVEDFANGDFRRRRARRRVRRSNPLKYGSSSCPSAYFRGLSPLSASSSFFPFRADDCRGYPNLTYIRPTKKSFAIDSIMGSYESPYLYSPLSVWSYPSLSLVGSREYPATSPPHSLLFHTSPKLLSCVSKLATNAIPGCAATSLESSAFSTYLGSKTVVTQGQKGSTPESWQETLSKLQDQLRKVTP
ncbi:forkhead box protein D2-like [Stylophora pistillata]|nr:forkhead box protein D2-like [Stylophora pistillata]